MSTFTSCRLNAIDPSELELLHALGRDLAGHRPEESVSAGGDQLRCCLTLSEPGERIWLVSHSPLAVDRPWREVGPVYVHAEPCAGYDPTTGLPRWLADSARVLRAYDATGAMVHEANRTTAAGADLGAALQAVLEQDRVVEVHVRNHLAQCFVVRATLA